MLKNFGIIDMKNDIMRFEDKYMYEISVKIVERTEPQKDDCYYFDKLPDEISKLSRERAKQRKADSVIATIKWDNAELTYYKDE